ncbi:MAG: hypothetical protein V3V41_04325, partial [Candidatus Heimdallarchaeota archaeon]
IMYLSILLVGALAIGGISVTMIAINNTMDDRAIETNLENILQNIAEVVHNLRVNGENQIELGATEVNEYIILTLPESVHNEEYLIEVRKTNTTYLLVASLLSNTDFTVSVSLLISPETITISGSIESTSTVSRVGFIYNGITSSIVLVD